MTGRDPKSRARSKDYLKQCLQEVNYLTSPQAVNPLPNRPLVSLGPTSTIVGSNAQTMGQQDNQQQPQAGPQQHQPHPQQHSQHQPITVALPNLPPFPSITVMNESSPHGGNTDTIGFNGRPRKLVPEVPKDFSHLNGGLEPSLMPANVGGSRDSSADPRDAKDGPEPTQQPAHDPMDEAPGHEEEALVPIPLEEPEPGQEQEQEQEPEQQEPEAETESALAREDTPDPVANNDSGLGGMFTSNLVTAIFRPDDQGEWKRKLQEAHDEATRAGTGLENISLGADFEDEVDSIESTEEESEDKAKVWKTRKTLRK
jgi:striatin 1/3/4